MDNYGDEFYGNNETRLESSSEILKIIFDIFKPKSILDVGCGRGAWLKKSKELGAEKIYGVDGAWNNGKLIDDQIVFESVDLNKDFKFDNQFDLTLCLEVAEHLDEKISKNFITCLTKTSNVILFSAAFKHQGGVNHVNENLHSYWGQLFSNNDFLVFDIIRPSIWDNNKISYWYRQNCFLYVRKNSTEYESFFKNYSFLKNLKLMDTIHPEMFFRKVKSQGLKYHLKQIIRLLKKKLYE